MKDWDSECKGESEELSTSERPGHEHAAFYTKELKTSQHPELRTLSEVE
jgi:hypothetical protein